jgi:hypothetical protein
MAGYDATTEIYYCKQSESPGASHRIAPAPTITISPEIYYANDSVIGYTYNITLNGYANALRKEIDAGSVLYGADQTIQHIGDIRDIFNTNGGNLYIKQNGSNIMVAKGATIKNITYNTSENRWVNYSPFTIELEFNEIDFTGCSNNPSIACNSSFFNAGSLSSNLIDIAKYKIKTFSDKWSFTIDNQIYNNYTGQFNNIFKVSYNLSATGKNYYINDNLIPAWQQAKMFVQERLYNQVKSLINGVLQIIPANKDGCSATAGLNAIHSTDSSAPRSGGMFTGGNTAQDGSAANYDIYNETINCSTSEADGTFSITYNATIKKNDPSLNPVENAVLHTYTKNISTTMEGSKNVSISVQGNIQGLVRGGFIYYNNEFSLPSNGTFISTIDATETKYSNALAYFQAKIGDGSDLLPNFKTQLDITQSQLLVNTSCEDEEEESSPTPASFTVDHGYGTGSVGYNVSYDTATSAFSGQKKGYSNVTIVRNDPVDMIQEFIIPGRIEGPIIQKLGMRTARTISINIDGASPENKECVSFGDGANCFDPCDNLPKFSIKNFEELLETNDKWIKTKEDYTSNKLDGSYSISLEYTCKG